MAAEKPAGVRMGRDGERFCREERGKIQSHPLERETAVIFISGVRSRTGAWIRLLFLVVDQPNAHEKTIRRVRPAITTLQMAVELGPIDDRPRDRRECRWEQLKAVSARHGAGEP